MACCGNRVTKKKSVSAPTVEIVESYTEGTDGFVRIKYLRDVELRVKGCQSGHIYLFANFVETVIDVNDAYCLFDKYPGLFMEIVELGTESGNSEDTSESPNHQSGIGAGDGQVY